MHALALYTLWYPTFMLEATCSACWIRRTPLELHAIARVDGCFGAPRVREHGSRGACVARPPAQDRSGLCLMPSEGVAARAAQHQHAIRRRHGWARPVRNDKAPLAATATATCLRCAVLSPPPASSGSSFPSRCASVPSVAIRGFSAGAGARRGRRRRCGGRGRGEGPPRTQPGFAPGRLR